MHEHSTVKADPDPVLERLREASADEAAALAYFEAMRWPDGVPACTGCGVVGESYKMLDRATGERERYRRWRCRACGERFTVRTASVLEESRLPLRVWAHAYWAACASKKGVSALQVQREVGVSYKTALYLMHRIRYAMSPQEGCAPLSGALEADETYVGGKPRKDVRTRSAGFRRVKATDKRPYRRTSKTPVVALVQRDGDVRFGILERVTSKTVGDFIKKHADPLASTLNTDESPVYCKVGKDFTGGHRSVNHSLLEYARPDGSHSNTAESVFARLKRSLYGTWHSVSKHHLHRYLDETAFKHNTRKMADSERVQAAMRGGLNRRLRYYGV
jgi:transposase-like protein